MRNFSSEIIEYIKENFPYWKFPDDYFGRWRYHEWECDTHIGIWSIHFGKFTLESMKKYEKDISKIKTFKFKGLKFIDQETSEIIISDEVDLDITFSFIRDICEKEKLIKKIKQESIKSINEFNTNDTKIYRNLKLKEILK